MKKVIEGKVYNTDTAKQLAHYYTGGNNFSSWSEHLYQTKKGQHFLYGTGGPTSKYAVSYPGGSSGGSEIILLNEDEVKEWLLSNQLIEEYEELFGDLEEG